MGTTLTNGRVIISGLYGVTANRGDFSSEKLSQGFTLEYDVAEDADTAAVIAQAEAEWAALVEQAIKPAVLDGLNLTGTLMEGGALVADLGGAQLPSNVTPITQNQAGGGNGGGAFPMTPPKATPNQIAALPRVIVDLDGTGVPQEWIDQRSLKADGTYKPGAADFKRSDGGKQVWINDKGGAQQQSVVDKLVEAGITV
ncbi:hypothetical protein LCGC14_2905180 [marine sediment metagenome]|uniref:Uncharacterized protein n=1 Tax=marine sediment metagenome TaxID=412755 RepID=A0A0F8XT65_9ZZZZ